MKHPLVREALSTQTALLQFQRKVENSNGLKFDNYWEFHNWSVDNSLLFWNEIWDFLDIIHSQPFTQVVEPNKNLQDVPEWFLGARLNYAENVLRNAGENAALTLIGEQRELPEEVSFDQLRDEVSILSTALRKCGIKAGDVVACHMSNRKEAITSMLAAASIGAMYTATNPLMGAKGVVDRFHQVSPKVLFSVDSHMYNKEEINFMKILPDIVKGLPSLELVIIVKSNEECVEREISCLPNSQYFHTFLRSGLDSDGHPPSPVYEQLPFSHPLLISYTSGTTGPPKGIVHSAGGALLEPLKASIMHLNIGNSDVLLSIYLTGWMTWQFFVTTLGLGANLVIYEGLPFYEHPTAFWDLIDRYEVTLTFLSPSVLDIMEKQGFVPGSHNSLKSLQTIVSGSSHVKANAYDFVYKHIKPDVFFSSIFGSTEFMSMFAGMNHRSPVYKEEIHFSFSSLYT